MVGGDSKKKKNKKKEAVKIHGDVNHIVEKTTSPAAMLGPSGADRSKVSLRLHAVSFIKGTVKLSHVS